ncbi:MAG: FG-GAP-like repeat-containing protein [Pirellulaceae bacterium]
MSRRHHHHRRSPLRVSRSAQRDDFGQFEKLEDRRVLASTLFVDFGFAFAGGQLSMNNVDSASVNGPQVFPGAADHIITSLTTDLNNVNAAYGGMFDIDTSGTVSAAEAQTFASRILVIANRMLEPFDVTIQQVNSANLAGINATVFSTANQDAYLVAAGVSDSDVDLVNCNGSCSAFGWAPLDIGNTQDNTGFAFLGQILASATLQPLVNTSTNPYEFAARMTARTVVHEAGHTWGLRHVDGQTSELRTRSSVMGVPGTDAAMNSLGDNRIWGRDFLNFMRYTVPTQVSNGVNIGGGTQNSFNVLSANIGLAAGSPFYVTGTGAADIITITDAGAGNVNITVQPFTNNTYSTMAGPAVAFLNQAVPNGILIEAGFDGDRIVIGSSVTAAIEVRGGDDLNATPILDDLQGPGAANIWVVNGTFAGTLNGTANVAFSEIENLLGGNQVDTFTVQGGGQINDLFGNDGNDIFNFNGGMVNDDASGGADNDSFVFNGGQVLDDIIGSAGVDTLDFSALGSQDVVLTANGTVNGFNGNLPAGTPLGDMFTSINEIIGSAAGTTDSVTGLNQLSQWNINNNSNMYIVGGPVTIDLSNFETFNGGSARDFFYVQATSFEVNLNGNAGDDRFILSSNAPSSNGNVSAINGTVNVDGGSGRSQLTVADVTGTGNNNVVVTDSAITGIAPATINYVGNSFSVNGFLQGVLIKGSDTEVDNITVQSFAATNSLVIETGGENDRIETRADALGPMKLDAGAGSDEYVVQLIVTSRLVVARDSGPAGADSLTALGIDGVVDEIDSQFGSLRRGNDRVFYDPSTETLDIMSLGGNDEITVGGASSATARIHTGTGNDRVVVDNTAGIVDFDINTEAGNDNVLVRQTRPMTTLTDVRGGVGNDKINVGSGVVANDGNLSLIQGPVLAIGGVGFDRINVNDRAAVGAFDYRINPTQVVNLPDASSLPRPEFAGITYDGTTEVLRVEGTDQKNIFEVTPSFNTRYVIDGNLPTKDDIACACEGDFLRLIADPASGRMLTLTDPDAGDGFWSFTNGFQNVHFLSIEKFNHVARLAAGADANNATDGGSKVRVYDAETRDFLFEFFAYDPDFRGGVRVSTGDINKDGIPDIITAPGRTHPPLVRVFNGIDGSLITEFLAYDTSFVGGVNVAAGHITGDCGVDIVTAPGRGVSEVRVFRNDGGGTMTLVDSFTAYEPDFIGGVSVATGDVNSDGFDDIITGSGSGRIAQVAIFDGQAGGGSLLHRFQVFGSDFMGGIFVAAGDVNGDMNVDVLVGAGANNTANANYNSLVHVFDSSSLINAPATFVAADFAMTAYANPAHNLRAPIHLAVKDYDLDGVIDELFTAQGPDGKSFATHVFAPLNPALVDTIFEADPEFSDGHYVG